MRLPILAAFASMMLAASVSAQDRRYDNEKLPGETGTYEGTKGDLSRKGEFCTHEKKVYSVEKNIGTVSSKGDETILVIRGHGFLNGRIVLKRDGDTWRGVPSCPTTRNRSRSGRKSS